MLRGAAPGLRNQMLKLRQLERVLQKIQRGCAGKPKDAPFVVSEPLSYVAGSAAERRPPTWWVVKLVGRGGRFLLCGS